jgi:hypothetical protein
MLKCKGVYGLLTSTFEASTLETIREACKQRWVETNVAKRVKASRNGGEQTEQRHIVNWAEGDCSRIGTHTSL